MRPTVALALASCLGLTLSACGGEGDDGNANMRPGDDCLSCHTGDPVRFTAAGTVFSGLSSSTDVGGATVSLEDPATHAVVTATTTSAGNFFFFNTISFPNTVTITRSGQTASHTHSSGDRLSPQTGHCNACHALGFRIHVP